MRTAQIEPFSALTYGTLLSSQGTDAHCPVSFRHLPRAGPANLVARAGTVKPSYATIRFEAAVPPKTSVSQQGSELYGGLSHGSNRPTPLLPKALKIDEAVKNSEK